MTTPIVFISYSHDSSEHADRVLELSDRLRAEGVDCILDQYEESPAEGWPRWMDKHIRAADFVLMVCTETYFHRVMGEEKPGTGLGVKWEGNLIYQHIYNADTTNKRFIPVLFDYSKVEHIPTPLQGATYYRMPGDYEKLYRRLTNQPLTPRRELGTPKTLSPRERKQDFFAPQVSLAKLPSTSPDLFGREKELALLDAAWSGAPVIASAEGAKQSPNRGLEIASSRDPSTSSLRDSAQDALLAMTKVNVLTLVAWGGVGKSALVNKWLAQMSAQNYRGAERVFGWSFYSQGAAEGRQVSADQFIATALAWFGDPDPNLGSPWDKGERLAELVKQSRALIILDGLEPLQNPPPVETGRVQDPALVAFLRELARQNPGLVVITTRLAVDDLKEMTNPKSQIPITNIQLPISASVIQIDLDNLSPEAGAAYLSHLGVDGTDAERQDAATDFGGHALALTLLGSYLKRVYRGDIRKHHEIPQLTDDQKQGAHARRVLESYERWLKGKPELDILRLMALFDRPAERGALDALRKEPAIKGLTDALQKLSDADWQFAVANLRDLRLLSHPERNAVESKGDDDALDCHPLLREHFGEQLKQANPAAWREGNNRLYEYYKSAAKEFPDTIAEMAPLYAAVMHGCQAGKHQEAYTEVYLNRIRRRNEYFAVHKLGAFGAQLATLANFFDPPWGKPVAGLTKGDRNVALGEAGLYLRALGRLAEAAQPMQTGLEGDIAGKDWKNAAIQARNLSELYLTIGDVTQALDRARQSVELADRSADAFQRMVNRTKIADTLHQAGHLTEAESVFREAEEIQEKARLWSSPILVSVWGFTYCNLLLDKEKYSEVQQRATQALAVAERSNPDLLTIALDNLSLGRAHLMQSQREANHPFTESLTYLNRAVDGLRQAGTQHWIPSGLLARAEYYRVTGALGKAKRDLDEAFSIATRGGMGLFVADCHLEYAWLAVATPTPSLPRSQTQRTGEGMAREHLAIAKKMIAETGYHRRDKEVEELEKQMSQLPNEPMSQ